MECILGSLWQRFVVFMTRKNNQPPLETQSESPFPKENYKRFLENKIRETWDFNGVPIQLIFKEK